MTGSGPLLIIRSRVYSSFLGFSCGCFLPCLATSLPSASPSPSSSRHSRALNAQVGTPKWTIRPAYTQALMSAAESRHRRRNPPSAAVPCRQPIRCQPSDLLACCRAPSRHRHSPPRQRPILVARLRSLPQPFVPCRRVVAEGRSHPSANLAFPFLPSLCRHNFVIFTSVAFRWLSAAIV